MAGDNELGTEGWNSCGKDESLGKKKKEAIVQTVQFHKLLSFADSLDVVMMIFGTVGAITNGLCMPLTTIFFGELTDSFGGNQSNKELVSAVTKISLKFLYLGIGAGVGGFLQVACWMVAGERQAARVRNLYLEAMMKQDVTFFDKEAISGEIVGRISGDTVFIQEAIGEKVGKFIQLVSSVIGGFVIAFAKGWLLTLILLSFIPLLLVCGGAMSIVISKTASQSQNAYSTATRVVDQTSGSIRTVASFSGEKQALASYNKSIVTAYNVGLKESLAVGLSFGIATFLLFSMFSLAVWIGPDMIQSKGYTGGDVMNIISSMLLGSTSLGHVSPCLTAFSAGQAAAFKMFKIIARKPEMDVYGIRGKKLDPLNGDIELRDIHFSYPTRPNEQIFRGFSLSVPSGTTTALVGQSGSGKSTVISLIERFYDPHAGEVLIDNINLKEFRLGWIRSKIGLVSQEPVLFTCSIMDNIAYGKKGATINEIRKAADLANASTFIDKLPQGLYTMVGEYGTQLSGGQKQRVAIARAVLKNPRILLLDEATSALDAESEMIVQEALDRVMANTTTIIISHRLNTIRNADMIAVVHQGTIVEKGSHSELLKDPTGPYSQLIQSQEWNKVSVERSEVMGEFSRRSSQKSSSFEHYSSHISSAQESSCRSASGTSFKEENTVFEQEEKPKKVSISRLACLNKPEIPDLLVGSLAAIVNGTIMPIFGLLMSEMIHLFFEPPNKRKEDSKFWAVIFVLLGITTLVVFPARTYFFSVAGGNLIKRIRSMCFEKVIHMEMSWFDEPVNSSGAIGARLSTDATMVRALVGDALAEVVQGCATAIAGLAIAFTASWQLSFIFLAMLPLMGLNGFLQMKFTKGFSADAKMMYEEASQVAKDAVGSIRTVASFCAEEQVMELYKRKCEGPMKSGMKLGLASGIGFGASFGLLFCVYAAIFYAGARLVEDGKATFTDVFRVFFALTMASLEISQSSSLSSNSTKAKIAAASIFAILDRKSNIDPSDKSGTVLKRVKGDIELRHISFKYPTRPDIQIFHDLSLTIRRGKTVALVGESGSGKSTVIALLQRFYDPDSGFITLDGFNIQKLQLKWLRQQMGMVSQEPILFNDTIRANIAYGKGGEDATEAEILEASKSANAFNFISSLQQGYDTVVGERGVQLSGGQKQRVAIARAMVKCPKIVLLDEATSSLDAESERVVQEALDRVTVNRTTVVVAHRLSTVRNADVIAVVKNGVIVEKGRHETLVEIEDGVYASLVGLHSSHL